MPAVPLFPGAVAKVTEWLALQGDGVASRVPEKERGTACKVWRLLEAFPALEGGSPYLVLEVDFPASPARIEFDRCICLRLPHVESDGHLCHSVLPEPQDFEAPTEAVGRVLARLREYFIQCAQPGWADMEFHRERQDYWSRYAAAAKAPAGFITSEVLLDVDAAEVDSCIAATVVLANEKSVLVTTSVGNAELLAKQRGWPVGTIVRGKALVLRLPSAYQWTPRTWPRSFVELDAIASRYCCAAPNPSSWYRQGRWPNKAPVFVVFLQEAAAFGWRIIPQHFARAKAEMLLPVDVNRIDRQWCLSRDYRTTELASLSKKQVLVFGCGALGSPVIELLARAGVGKIEVVDPQRFEAENVSRHVLDVTSIGGSKASALATRINMGVPGAKVIAHKDSALRWLAQAAGVLRFDLVIDCTGEAAVRVGTSRLRASALAGAPLLMGWMEPFGAAVHAVAVTGSDEWPDADPAESLVNFATWPDDLLIRLPGCGHGFHPYGMADVWRGAGLVVQRALALLGETETHSGIWSMVRDKDYFSRNAPDASLNREIPSMPGMESVTVTRDFGEVFDGR